jgi:hypothetical protein
MGKPIVLLLAVLALGGCVAPKSTLLGENTALISMLGRPASDRENISNAVLAEAAKITREHGYRYFVILKAEDTSREGVMLREDQSVLHSLGAYRGRPGATDIIVSRNVAYVQPGFDLTIRMYKDGEIDPRLKGVWNTQGTMGPLPGGAPPQRPVPSRLPG